MGKRISFPTRSFGSDAPAPEPGALAAWVGARRGRAADLITYQLEERLSPQLDAGITSPCAGGRFYRDRLLGSLAGAEGTAITGEVGFDIPCLVNDAGDLTLLQKNIWLSAPSPHALGLTDRYFHDRGEAAQSLFSAYQDMMRAMRDAGIAGHVLLFDRPDGDELEALASRKVFFFSHEQTRQSLSLLLEYQASVAIRPSGLGIIRDLMGEYEVRKIVILDAEEKDLLQALEVKDQDDLICGGYCQDSCTDYWKSVAENASLVR